MIKDLKGTHGFCNGIEKVYLVDEQKRITSPYFNVWIPSLMEDVEQGIEDTDETMDLSSIINDEKGLIKTNVKKSGSIRAKSIHPYRFRHDGWIPQFKTDVSTYEEMKMVEGTGDEIAASSTDGETMPGGGPPHNHVIKAGIKLMTNTFKKFFFKTIESKTMVHNKNTEVDYQDLNKVYIKKGHPMYGCFVGGGDNSEFVIIAIDDVIPYYDEDEDSGDVVSTNDGKWGPENKE